MLIKDNKPRVSIVKGLDPYKRTLSALRLLDEAKIFPDSKVLIKINMAPFYQFYGTHKVDLCSVSTNTGVVKAVFDFLKECGAKDITIAEGPCAPDIGEDATFGFKACGYVELCKQLGCKLIDLDIDEIVDVKIPNALSLKNTKIARTVLESDFIVSIPVMRTHSLSIVSLCMKNLMGCIALNYKRELHPDNDRSVFHERLFDLVKLLKPDLSVIDASGCSDKLTHEKGLLHQLNLTIAGKDVVAVDSVGAAVMGVPWEWLAWLVIAHRKGLGVGNLNQIKVVGESINAVRYRAELER